MLKIYIWRINMEEDTLSEFSRPWYAEVAPTNARAKWDYIYNIDPDRVVARGAFHTHTDAVNGGRKLLQLAHAEKEQRYRNPCLRAPSGATTLDLMAHVAHCAPPGDTLSPENPTATATEEYRHDPHPDL